VWKVCVGHVMSRPEWLSERWGLGMLRKERDMNGFSNAVRGFGFDMGMGRCRLMFLFEMHLRKKGVMEKCEGFRGWEFGVIAEVGRRSVEVSQ